MNTNKHNPITAGNLLGSDPDFTGNETTDGYMRRIRGRVAKSVTSITPTELAEWRAVVEKATPGPLTVDDGDSSLIGVFGNDGTVVCYMSEIEPAGYRRGYDSDRANAELFALARTALPRLIDEVEAGRREIDKLKSRVWGTISGGNLSVRGYHDEGDVGSGGEPWVTEEESGRRWSCYDVQFAPDKERITNFEKVMSRYLSNHVHLQIQHRDAEAKIESLRTQLHAWAEVFGTSQLTHAKARLDAAEFKAARLERELREAQGEVERLSKLQTQEVDNG